MTVVAIAADKGGVGKSTTARNLTEEAGRLGLHVLAVDADKQADLTELFDRASDASRGMHVLLGESTTPDIRHHIIRDVAPHVDLVPSHPYLSLADRQLISRNRREYILERAFQPVVDHYDMIVVDLGHSDLIRANVFAVAGVLVIPTTTAWLDAMHIKNMLHDAATTRKDLNLPILDAVGNAIVSVWHRSSRSAIERTGLENIQREFGSMMAPWIIPTSAQVQQASYERLSVRRYRDERALKREARTLDPVVEAYEQLTAMVVTRMPHKVVA
jgi:chromosome partitioning protein